MKWNFERTSWINKATKQKISFSYLVSRLCFLFIAALSNVNVDGPASCELLSFSILIFKACSTQYGHLIWFLAKFQEDITLRKEAEFPFFDQCLTSLLNKLTFARFSRNIKRSLVCVVHLIDWHIMLYTTVKALCLTIHAGTRCQIISHIFKHSENSFEGLTKIERITQIVIIVF